MDRDRQGRPKIGKDVQSWAEIGKDGKTLSCQMVRHVLRLTGEELDLVNFLYCCEVTKKLMRLFINFSRFGVTYTKMCIWTKFSKQKRKQINP